MKRIKLILERSPAENGAAALAMILDSHQKPGAVQAICQEGCGSGRELVETARRHGLYAEGYQMAWEQLQKAPLPCIVHLDFCAFAVLTRIGRKRATLYSPREGILSLSRIQFERRYTGVALCFSSMTRETSVPKAFRPPSSPKSLKLFLSGTGLFVGSCILAAAGLAGKLTANSALQGRGGTVIVPLGILLLMLAVGGAVWLSGHMLDRWSDGLEKELQGQCQRALERAEPSYINHHSAGELADACKAAGEIAALSAKYWRLAFLLIPAAMTAAGLLTCAPVAAVGLILPQAVLLWLQRDDTRLYGSLRLAAHRAGLLHEAFCGRGGASSAEQLDALRAAAEGGQALLGYRSRCIAACAAAMALFLFLGLRAISDGGLPAANFPLCLLLGAAELVLFGGFSQILPVKAALQSASEDYALVPDQLGEEKAFSAPQRLLLQNLTVETRSGDRIFHNVTLAVPRGKALALLAGHGEEIVRILAGEEDPGQGSIYLDDVKLSALNLRQRYSVLRRIGGGLPAPAGTLLENLRVSAPAAGEQLLAGAAEDGGLGRIVFGPGAGLDTPAESLSTGEKLLLHIACGFAEGVPNLIIGEKEIGLLDMESLAGVIRAARRRGLAIILVTTDEKAAALCDTVCRLAEGRIVWKEAVERGEVNGLA